MRTVLKHIVANTYKPLLVRYLSKTRAYRYGNTRLEIPPQVFHPGFFVSTQFLLQNISQLSLAGKSFLELGAGSGLISFQAAKKGAKVTATDINPIAIEYLHINKQNNNTLIDIIQSDLLENIRNKKAFDIIAINPPYYKKQPQTLLDYAWYCGEHGEYFEKLFSQLPHHIHRDTKILMVLCEGCDIEMIKEMAAKKGFALKLVRTKQTMLEKNFIFKVEQHS